jgi:hypothetical protein
MTDGKYAKYIQPLRLRTELVHPSFRGKIAKVAGGEPREGL